MSHALLRHLVTTLGEPLFTVASSMKFWTERSDRATLVSLAACVPDIANDWLDHLGRWSAKASQGYVRTHMRRTASIQQLVATAIRSSRLSLGEFGEDDLYAQWAKFMCDGGVPQNEAVSQASLLASYSAGLLKSRLP